MRQVTSTTRRAGAGPVRMLCLYQPKEGKEQKLRALLRKHCGSPAHAVNLGLLGRRGGRKRNLAKIDHRFRVVVL